MTQSDPSTRRKSTGKRLRFEVFKRDHFTCRYCGAQPPEVVLVIDHLIPVKEGGTNAIENLITSCEACNQGKSARLLGLVQPPADADLMYLSVQQEIAEMRRYKEAVDQREAAMAALIDSLQNSWIAATGFDWVPSAHVVRRYLRHFDVEITRAAMEDVAIKLGNGYLDSRANWLGYMWKVAATMSAQYHEGDPSETSVPPIEQVEEISIEQVEEPPVDQMSEPVDQMRERSCPLCGGPYIYWFGHARRCSGVRAQQVAVQEDYERQRDERRESRER